MISFRTIRSALFRGWMKFAHILALINTTLILTIVYLALIGPMAIVMKIFRRDPLGAGTPPAQGSFWKIKGPVHHTIADSKRQF